MTDMTLKDRTEIEHWFDGWTFEQIDARIKYRTIGHIYPEDLRAIIEVYPEKINETRRRLVEFAEAKSMPELYPEMSEQDETTLLEKLERLKDKYACALKEWEFRVQKKVKREYHHTLYYIDLNGGNDGLTGLSTAQAWLHIEQYTTVTVRTAGDIAKVRANTTEIPVGHIVTDESGTPAALCEIRGCSSIDDPWGDASDVLPIIDFNNGAFRVDITGDSWWRLYRLEITNNNTTDLVRLGYTGNIVEACDIHTSSYGGCIGILCFTYSSGHIVKDCDIHDLDNGIQIDHGGSYIYVENTTIDVDLTAVRSNYGGGLVDMVDCVIGNVTVPQYDFNTSSGSLLYVRLRNCWFTASIALTNLITKNSVVVSEDDQQNSGDQHIWTFSGEVERDNVIQIDGEDSWLMTPTLNQCTENSPLVLRPDHPYNDWEFFLAAGVARTITVKARETAAWAADPTAAQFYVEVSYLDHAVNATRSTQVSAQSLNGVNIVNFTATVTPAQEGWAYVRVVLKDSEAGMSVNVTAVPYWS